MSSALLTTPLPGYRQGSSPVAGLWLVEDIRAFREGVEGDSGWALAFGGIALAADAIAFMLDPIGQLIGHGLSWVLEHLNPLASWLDQLTGDAAGVLAMSEKLKFVESELANIQTKLGTMRQALNAQSGQTVSAASAFFADIEPQIGAIASASSGVGTALEIGSSIVQVVHDLVRDALSEIAGTAISAALVSAATLGMALPAEIANIIMMVSRLANKCGTAISHVVSVFSKIKGHMAKLWSALGELIAKLSKYAGDTKAFKYVANTKVADRAKSAFRRVSSSGKPSGWSPFPFKNTTGYNMGKPWKDTDAHWDGTPILSVRDADSSAHIFKDDLVNSNTAYGFNADGSVRTEAQWKREFTHREKGGRTVDWPPNGSVRPETSRLVSGLEDIQGMVPNTERIHSTTDELINTVGGQFDRIGHPGGKFGGAYVDGRPAPFDMRGVDPSSIELPHYTYRIKPGVNMPDGIYAVTGEIAPALGFKGGGTQIQFYNSKTGKFLMIDEAVGLGIVESVR